MIVHEKIILGNVKDDDYWDCFPSRVIAIAVNIPHFEENLIFPVFASNMNNTTDLRVNYTIYTAKVHINAFHHIIRAAINNIRHTREVNNHHGVLKSI